MKYFVKDQKTKEELCQIVNGPIPQIGSELSIDGAGKFYVQDISYYLYPTDQSCDCVVLVLSDVALHESIIPRQNFSADYWSHMRATEYFVLPGDL